MKSLEILKQLADKTKKTRTLQKSYFETRDRNILQSSKNAERDLDKFITEIEKLINANVLD